MSRLNIIIGTLTNGGAERAVSNISLNLERKIKTKIILYGEESKVTYPYSGEIIYLDRDSHSSLLKKIKSLINRVQKVRHQKKSDHTATTLSFLIYPNLLNLLSHGKGKKIISVRNHMSTNFRTGFKSKIWKRIIKYLYPKADLVVAVSKEIKKDLTINFGIPEEKVKVIYNSYNLSEIHSKSQEKLEDEKGIFDKPVVISVGRLSEQKGHWHLIRAFAEVSKQIPNVQLVILGNGPLKKYLISLSEGLGIANNVHFLGFQENPFKYISKSSVFVMSSFYEGFPNALAEAMGCGVPVISTDCFTGPREILSPNEFNESNLNYELKKERYGVLVPVCDGKHYASDAILTIEEKIMSDRIITLLEQKYLRAHFSERALKRVKDFEIKETIKQWESIL